MAKKPTTKFEIGCNFFQTTKKQWRAIQKPNRTLCRRDQHWIAGPTFARPWRERGGAYLRSWRHRPQTKKMPVCGRSLHFQFGRWGAPKGWYAAPSIFLFFSDVNNPKKNGNGRSKNSSFLLAIIETAATTYINNARVDWNFCRKCSIHHRIPLDSLAGVAFKKDYLVRQ